ncbi:hypothetical protein [Oculatella sp. LEGE 06141]|uniref:hypothetical protein n=1 Tax=Oculatella sp. LEGE 06141 TaxID=1828648 RepID=UPI001880B745|nr:hypothetical protein [Oculatella sp. LEGE 06141]
MKPLEEGDLYPATGTSIDKNKECVASLPKKAAKQHTLVSQPCKDFAGQSPHVSGCDGLTQT